MKTIFFEDISGMRNRCFGMMLAVMLLCAPVAGAEQEAYPVIFEATQRAILSAEIAGVLTGLKYDIGNAVKKGSLIAQVDIGDLGLRRKRSELSLRHLTIKVTNLERLMQRGLTTEEELAQAQMERDIATTDIQIFKQQIGKAQIIAPFDGVVVRRNVHAYEWVTAGQPVVEIVSPASLRAVANIPSRVAVKLAKDATYNFEVHDLGISVSGTVQAVVPEVDELSNTAQVIWKLDKASKDLTAGMKGEVRIDKP